jgi:hypothetical protein
MNSKAFANFAWRQMAVLVALGLLAGGAMELK